MRRVWNCKTQGYWLLKNPTWKKWKMFRDFKAMILYYRKLPTREMLDCKYEFVSFEKED